MADIKTILRELSVPCQIYLLQNELNYDLFNPQFFDKICNLVLSNKDNSTVQNQLQKITNFNDFTQELKQIINNGINLGNLIFSSREFNFESNLKVEWKGCYEENNIIDIVINQYSFSLKEESFILKNMGLYQYINLITDNNKPRGLHIFKEFAPLEFENWFNITWNELVNYLLNNQSWKLSHTKGYESSINKESDEVIFNYNDNIIKLNLNCNLEQFENKTNSVIREKVFAKWINQYLKNNQQYEISKKNCAEVAGKNLVNFLNQNKSFTQTNLKQLLQILPKTYYFAKTTQQHQFIYKVPSSPEFNSLINIKNINYSVPRSQLNVITEIENKSTGNILTLRNELRYSHGQFNGTPEAKMYYDEGNSTGLEVFYIPIR
jgi:hypothetical protein